MDDKEKVQDDRYRFGGFRYGLRGSDTWGPNEYIPEETSLYPFPRHEAGEWESSSSEED